MEKTTAVVGTYLNEVEAQLTLQLLEAEGVEAMIQKDNCGGMYPQMALIRGIRVLVSEADESAARTIIDARAVEQPSPGWTCPSCGTNIEEGFSACWQCGQETD